MAQTFAPLAALILLTGCFQATDDDDEIGGATEDTGDSTDGSTSTDTDGSTSTDTTETTSTDETTEEDTTDGPMCEPDQTECGTDCVDDLSSDPDHCGACGHSCLGGECAAGVCGPVDLASGKGRLLMVLVDADYIYYGGDGVDVGRMKKDGTDDLILKIAGPTNQDREWCYDSAITNNSIVWGNDWVQPGVRGCMTPDCAGGVQTFVPGLNLYAMAYSKANDTLYWNQGPEIHQRTWPGGTANVFMSSNGQPRSLATDADFVYWSASIAPNVYRIYKAPVGGGAPFELIGSRPVMDDIEVGPNYVYWAEDAQIFFAPLPNGGPAQPFGTSGANVGFMAIDATHLYWTSGGDEGSIQRCPLEGCAGAPELLAPAAQPWSITLDPLAVYWGTQTGGIHKIAK